MLYPKNSKLNSDDSLFRNPTSEYRGTPFWSWNGKLDTDEYLRQIEIFKKMGFGGFHMHVRTGLKERYLSDRFMDVVKQCVDKAEDEDMLVWLYDEDRYPSGAAGGFVTENPAYVQKKLRITQELSDKITDNGYPRLIACFDIVKNNRGFLTEYRVIAPDDETRGEKWYAYLELMENSSWYNNRAYVDTLKKEAIEKFIAITHEKYKECVGSRFGTVIPAIFTDEPQFSRKQRFKTSFDKTDCTLPWTDDLCEGFEEKFGLSLTEHIPELFWELPDGKISKCRYLYHNYVCDRFVEAFSDTIGDWCSKNGIYLTGHVMEESSLEKQTCAVGEAMRSYRSFGIPGIDMLCASFEFTTAKQCQSAVNQYGREGMLSELYGVTGWDYDFRGYKLHGDWQECLGVTVRVPHLSWASMGGGAKRDYPASISYQSPWWTEYSAIEDHFARVNTLMTRGKPVVKVGVIHPIESYWLKFGPEDITWEAGSEMDEKFNNLTQWLLKNNVDFDFISEALLPDLCPVGSYPFKVGKMEYDVIIVPGCLSLRETTIDRLDQFRILGGKLIFMGSAPEICDGEKSGKGIQLYGESVNIPFDSDLLLAELEEYRLVKITDCDGSITGKYIYNLKKDGDFLHLFISRCCEPDNKYAANENNLLIQIKGSYIPILYNTITGETENLVCDYKDGYTVIPQKLYDYDSLLLKLVPGKTLKKPKAEDETKSKPVAVPDKVEYELSEDNALLIDICEYSLDGGEFRKPEEILRLDNICREELGFEPRGGHSVQPWAAKPEPATHLLTLRYKFRSTVHYIGAHLAIEEPESAEIYFNGQKVKSSPDGWWTDKDIRTVPLPAIAPGDNLLEVILPFGKNTNTEWMYILGRFGVAIENGKSVITSLPYKLKFESITEQGLPFYGGNISYIIPFECGSGVSIRAGEYHGALITAKVDDKPAGRIIYPPYKLTVNNLSEGSHCLKLTLFGNRVNCFGPVHRTVDGGWLGPDSWKTQGDQWTYNYCLKTIGLTEKPEIEVI